MLGAIVLKLRAQNAAALPIINGRLMHAAFFRLLHGHDPELEVELHARQNIKPFTVSMLDPIGKVRGDHIAWQVSRHDEFIWRLTVLNEELFRAVMSFPLEQSIQVGALQLGVDDVIAEGRRDCNVESKVEFIEGVRSSAAPKGITFRFVSPTTFRIDDRDAPYPRAELIFGSLADKWSQSEMPATVDKQLIKELATAVHLTTWNGRSKRIYFGRDRGTPAFWGEFNYNVERLEPTARRVFELLAWFAEYSGVGRLTAQGFGQTRVAVQ